MTFGNFILGGSDSGKICAESVRESRRPSFSLEKVVRIAGLEPARLAALPPQSSVSANSTISATRAAYSARCRLRCKRFQRPRAQCPNIQPQPRQVLGFDILKPPP